ncbi:nuclear GTPase SLIP-GC-like [Scleropages formosus]|uniref:nuclear GTPase SLIP-GC-like n=1 Tax=Scleropages formosus TaxID=113540 RepID=UPI0010FA9183|nr:nuclear GTPase SLIP-GC-like [Scleropages formosus]
MGFLETFRKNITSLAEHKPIDKIYIGVFGRTGAGKSSLINAIVNEKHLLPCGGSQACTSVIVYVEANTKSDKYRADIDLMSKQEWDAELRFLLETLSNDQEDRTDADTEYDDDADEMRDMAKEKIKSLYGEDGLEKGYDELVGNKKVSDILKNCSISLTYDTAEELSDEIGRYIRSDSDGDPQYWPLVKCVTISLPRSPALLDTIVLVDLPGAGDANKQRDEMWKECLSRCASIWIVNDINRALSDKEAQKIFQESLRSIAGGGECHNITFICTKTDNIDAEEIKRNYNIKGEELEITEFKDSPDYEKKEKQACIKYRNEKVKDKFMKNHKVKAENFLLGKTADSNRHFNVFTVSSREYSLIQEGKNTTLDEDKTELPMLIEHMKKIYVWHSEKAVKDYVSDVAGVVTFLHLSKNPCNAKIASYTSKEFGRLEKELNDECEELHKFLTNVQSKLRNNLVKGVKEAEKHCLTNGRKFLEPLSPEIPNHSQDNWEI